MLFTRRKVLTRLSTFLEDDAVFADFIDKSGFFASRNVGSVFHALNEALDLVQGKLRKSLYIELCELSDRMRAHFEADPDDKTGDARKGQALINKMTDLLIRSIRASQQPAAS